MKNMEYNQVALRILNNSLKEKHLAQCYLFTGGDPVTKLDMAYYFSKAIIDHDEALNFTASNLLRRLKDKTCPDFFFIDGRAASIKAQSIEIFLKEIYKTALEANGRKVYLIDNVNNASPKVLNALLKFIEEAPSENTFGILISDHLESLLGTLVSRCEIVPFSRNSLSAIVNEYQNNGFEEEDAYFLSIINGYYVPTDFADQNYLIARDLIDDTINNIADITYLPYVFHRKYLPIFRKDRNLQQIVLANYFKMLDFILENALYDSDVGKSIREKADLFKEHKPLIRKEITFEILKTIAQTPTCDYRLQFERLIYLFWENEEEFNVF